ncbi:sulfate transporter, partial [Trifolium medium]|nr:sulfate transporter [Trifolium medium]
SYTVEKVRLDYARVLIATSAIEVIKGAEKLLVDGVMVEVKIMEEWGYALGEDACLYEDGNASETSYTDNEEEHGDPEASNNVDTLVEHIVNELNKEESPSFQKSNDSQQMN